MRAVRYYGPGDIRLEHDVPEPVCDAHQVKIRPAFCGICGSDLHVYQSPDALPFKDVAHPVTGETWPVTLGHEFSGDVVEIGARAQTPEGLRVGDRVAVQPTICCDQCIPCKEGLTNCCDSFGFVGFMGWGGGLSDYVCVDARFVFKLPETIPADIGGKKEARIIQENVLREAGVALVEPLAVAWHAIEQSCVNPGDNILVMGAGPIGLAVLQCLKLRKPAQLIVAEVTPSRRTLAQKFGATTVINPNEIDVISECKRLCNGQGPEIAFDCAGAAATIKSACLSIRSKGTVVNVAKWDKEISFDMNDLLFGEKRLLSALSYTRTDFERVINALDRGSMDVEDMITRRITIDRVVEDGILALLGKKNKHIKILVNIRK